jgi:glycosyltransferase involved in cell wall biosynthesis
MSLHPVGEPNGRRLSIGVALCTFRGGAFLKEQLDSIARQTRLPDSVVVVDDASGDETVSIVERFAAQAPFPVRLSVNSENIGYIRNFDRAIGLVDADLVALADQDDVWVDSKLEILERVFLEKPEVGIAFSDAFVVDRALRAFPYSLWQSVGFGGSAQHQLREGQALDVLVRGNMVTGATMMFRSEFRALVQPVPDGIEHDAWIPLLIAAVAGVEPVAERLIRYRQHGSNQIGARKLSIARRLHRARQLRTEGLRQRLRQQQKAVERLELAGLSASEACALLRESVAHLAVRAGLPASRWGRLQGVLAETIAGRYSRHSSGWRSAVRDVVA